MAVVGASRGRQLFDVSFIASFKCDLACTFCMYSSGPDVDGELDPAIAQQFINTIDLDCVNAFGLYGGEPALFLPQNTAILHMLPRHKPKFVISNGTWSCSDEQTREFMGWADEWRLRVFVSSTPQHQRAQDRAVLRALAEADRIVLKPAETKFIPMGRLVHPNAQCTRLCDRDEKPTRIALQPDGMIMFQNCDGDYPAIGTAAEGFRTIRERLIARAWRKCPLYETETRTVPLVQTISSASSGRMAHVGTPDA